MRLSPAHALLLAALAACADASGGWHGTVRDSAGVRIVENPAAPAGNAAWHATELLRIGSADGPVETQFGLIASVALDTSGRIHVLDQQHRRVRVFAPDGTFLHDMGGAGAGPGEFSNYTIAVMVDPGDTVWVADLGNARFERFSPDGESLGSIPMPVPGGALPIRFTMLDDGTVLEVARTRPTPTRPDTRDDLLLEIGPDGAVRDTLHRMPGSQAVRFRGDVAVLSAYAPESVWAIEPDGRLYTGRSDTYRIEVRRDGVLERIIERDHVQRVVTDADQRAFLVHLRRTLTEQGTPPEIVERMVVGMTFAPHYPVFAHFLPGPDGTLWVQHIRTAEDAIAAGETFDAANVGSDRWDVFDAAGRYIATARLPDRFTPLTFRDSRFIGIWRDELDVQHLLIVEVRPATS